MLIQQDKYTRNNWQMGRVTKIIKGKDGFARAANVEYVKNIKKSIINRSVNKLYPIKLKFVDEKDISFVKSIYVDVISGKRVEKRYFTDPAPSISLYIYSEI